MYLILAGSGEGGSRERMHARGISATVMSSSLGSERRLMTGIVNGRYESCKGAGVNSQIKYAQTSHAKDKAAAFLEEIWGNVLRRATIAS